MKEVLVLSDNETLVRHVKEVINSQAITAIAKFEFRFSKSNKNPSALVKLGMKPIDLKEEGSCKEIVNTYQLVLSLHCKQIFPSSLVKKTTCINFHPGLNPYNRGWYPQVFSIINKKPIGATIHLMDELVDHGPIIAQEEIFIRNYETSLDVYSGVIKLEKSLITKHLKNIIEGNYKASPVGQDGNYNSIRDFNSLCHLNLDAIGSLKQHIDLLRALTHGDFKNAFYLDAGRKIYVRIELTPDDDIVTDAP